MKPTIRQKLVYFLNRKFNLGTPIVVTLKKHPNIWEAYSSFTWDYGMLDDAFRRNFYTTEVGKWLLDHPWHTVNPVGLVSIAELDDVYLSMLQFHFLKKSDAALFKLTFSV